MPNASKQRLHIEAPAHHVITGQIVSNHRIVHYLAFGSTALLLLLLTRGRKQEFAVVAATIFLGLCIEIAEHASYGAPFEYWDVIDDAIAVLLAYAAFLSLTAARRTTKFR